MKKKGAMQMSLGFIIAVVFAVVLLSLAIVWLRGMMENVSGLTVDLTQQARNELADTFKQTRSNFAIWPKRQDMERGKTLILSAGIKNNDPEGKDKWFFVNVQCTASDSTVANAQKLAGGWVTIPTTAAFARASDVVYRDITLNVPTDAPDGNYIFDVVACYWDSNPGTPTCTSGSSNLWASQQPLTITVRG